MFKFTGLNGTCKQGIFQLFQFNKVSIQNSYSGTSVFDLPIQTIRFLTKNFELRMLPNLNRTSNTQAGNQKEASGVEWHFKLDLAGTKKAEWRQNALGDTLRPFSNCITCHFEPDC